MYIHVEYHSHHETSKWPKLTRAPRRSSGSSTSSSESCSYEVTVEKVPNTGALRREEVKKYGM